MGYFKHAIKGVSWSIALRGYTRILTLIRIILLARFFLNPYQFGLFGLVTLVLSLLEILTETGINIFLIQEKESLKKYVSSAWIVSIIRGIVIACILILFAYPTAHFFNSPITTLLLVTAIIPFVRGFINPSEVVFQKELFFGKEFFFRSVLFTIESLAVIITAAFMRNAFSFLIGMMISALSEVIISFVFIKPRPTLSFHWEDIQMIFHKGKWVTLYGVFQYFAENADNITVGKVLGTSPLAIYENAYNLSILPVSEITDVISKVIFPLLVKLRDDHTRLICAFFKSLLAISALSIFISIVLALFARQVVLLTFGDKWLGIASILPLLTIYGCLRAIFGFSTTLFLSVNKQDWVARMIFVRFIGLMISVVPLTMYFGMYGTVYAAIFSAIVELPMSIMYTAKIYFKKHENPHS